MGVHTPRKAVMFPTVYSLALIAPGDGHSPTLEVRGGEEAGAATARGGWAVVFPH